MAEKRTCSSCGAKLPADASGGVCTSCLLTGGPCSATPELPLSRSGVSATLPPLEGVAPALSDTTVADEPLGLECIATPPRQIGDYEIVDSGRRGGMGVVYRAKHSQTGATVALKMIKSTGEPSAAKLRRFLTEAQAASRLDHPNIVPVYHFGEHSGQPYYTMRFVAGGNVAQKIEDAPLPLRQAVALIASVARAVHHAHVRGVLHRDLKPSNILLDSEDQPLVSDFGLAKWADEEVAASVASEARAMAAAEEQAASQSHLTRSGLFLGTPDYCSPEQAEGRVRELTPASDIFSLGSVFYHLLTGVPPFKSDSVEETLRKVRQEEPPTPSSINRRAEPDLEAVCLRCLRKDPGDRYRSAEAMAKDLENWLRQFEDLQRSLRSDHAVTVLQCTARLLRQNPADGSAARRLLSALTQRNFALLRVGAIRHGDRIRDVHYSPDGRYLASASDDRTACVWDAVSGLPLTDPLKHLGRVRHVQFSPDGQRLATAAEDSNAQIWETRTGKPFGRPFAHEAKVYAARFSPNGRWLVTCSADSTGRLWDVFKGALLFRPLQHAGPVRFGQFSPDGERLVTASDDHTARIWDASTGQPLADPIEHGSRVYSAQFGPGSDRFVTASEDGTARLVAVSGGRCQVKELPHAGPVQFAEFSPDGLRVVTASSDGTARVWDARTGLPLTPPLAHESLVSVARFSPEGERLVTASFDKTARVWDARTGRPISELLLHTGAVSTAQFSPDGLNLATGSLNGYVSLWDIQSGQSRPRRWAHRSSVQCTRFGKGDRALTTSQDGTARLLDARTGQQLMELCHNADRESPVFNCGFSHDGRLLFTATRISVQVWDAFSGRLLCVPITVEKLKDQFRLAGRSAAWALKGYSIEPDSSWGRNLEHLRIDSAQLAPDGERIVAVATNFAWIADTSSGEVADFIFSHSGGGITSNPRIGPVTFSPDGKLLATGSDDHTARVWDLHTGELLSELTHGFPVFLLQFSPDGQRLFSGSDGAQLWNLEPVLGRLLRGDDARPWDPAMSKAATVLFRGGSLITSARFSCDGRLIVTASHDKTVRVWDSLSGQANTDPIQHSDCVRLAEFSPEGETIASASANEVRFWDAHTGLLAAEPCQHEDRVLDIQFSPDGRRLISASADNAASVWEILIAPPPAPDWLPELADAAINGDALGLKERVLSNERGNSPVRSLAAPGQPHAATLSSGENSNVYARWARWFFADRSARAISPSSETTVPEYVLGLIQEKTFQSARDAVLLAPADPFALAALATALLSQDPEENPRRVCEAEFLSRRALQLGPKSHAVFNAVRKVADLIAGLRKA